MRIPFYFFTLDIEISRAKFSKRQIRKAVMDAVERSGSKLDGVKAYRQITGASLVESKAFVDALCPDNPVLRY